MTPTIDEPETSPFLQAARAERLQADEKAARSLAQMRQQVDEAGPLRRDLGYLWSELSHILEPRRISIGRAPRSERLRSALLAAMLIMVAVTLVRLIATGDLGAAFSHSTVLLASLVAVGRYLWRKSVVGWEVGDLILKSSTGELVSCSWPTHTVFPEDIATYKQAVEGLMRALTNVRSWNCTEWTPPTRKTFTGRWSPTS